jgi:protein SCO1/2
MHRIRADTWKERTLDPRSKLMIAAGMAAMLLLSQRAWPHADHVHGAGAKPAQSVVPGAKAVKLADTVLQDQDGRSLRLASDVAGDKLVVVTFVFTHCTDTCPTVSHTFAQLQDKLGALLERRVRLVSLSVDPARDTPARMKEHASLFDAKPGWLWLTGDAANVRAALQSFGVHVAKPGNHPAQVLVGDPRSGRWTRLYDIDNAQQLFARVNELLAQTCTPAPHPAAAGHARPGCVAQPG